MAEARTLGSRLGSRASSRVRLPATSAQLSGPHAGQPRGGVGEVVDGGPGRTGGRTAPAGTAPAGGGPAGPRGRAEEAHVGAGAAESLQRPAEPGVRDV